MEVLILTLKGKYDQVKQPPNLITNGNGHGTKPHAFKTMVHIIDSVFVKVHTSNVVDISSDTCSIFYFQYTYHIYMHSYPRNL